MKLGLGSYTFGWAVGVKGFAPPQPLNEQGLLDRCRSSDVKLLQIGDNLPLHEFDGERLDRLAIRARQEGVELEIGARRLTCERVATYAVLARRLGARLVRFVIDDAGYHPNPQTVAGVLRECAPSLEGLTLGIENHDRFSAAALRSMIEDVSSERIGVCLDTANSMGAGEGIETVVATLAPLTVNLHIKDFHIERLPHLMGFTITGRPAGSGMLKAPELLACITRFGKCQSAVLELWTPPEPRLEDTIFKESAWAVQSLDYLKPFFR